MRELTAFLTARIDEDEAIALKVKATWRLDGPDTGVIIASVGRNAEQCAEAYWVGVGEHIVRHDPARVLREVAVNRRIVATYTELDAHPNRLTYAFVQQQWVVLRAVIAALALPYSDHDDYQSDWALEGITP